MFGFNKKNPAGETLTLKIDGMHCTSCSLNIDGELEDLDGVISATTSYAKATTRIEYDETKIDKKAVIDTIRKLGYQTAR